MKALSLFSGIGGLDLGAEWAGIKTIAFCEYADFPRAVLKKHWKDIPIFKDVTTLNKKSLESEDIDIGTIDIIHGGFPCQPYSTAGKQKGTEDDRDLWPAMFNIIKEIKPNWVVGENVANFANMELDRTLSDLEGIGYETKAFILPACAIGAIHQRQRIFVVAHSDSRRWGSLEESSEVGCDWVTTESIGLEIWKRKWAETNHIFSTGARILDTGIGKLERNDNGFSEGMDRLRGIGNAVMPQQVYPVFKAIVEIDKIINYK